MLAHSSYSYLNFIFESFCFIFRSWVRGLLQGILVNSYKHQIISLAVSDGIFMILTIIFHKCFFSRALFGAILFYNITFLVLDSFLALRYTQPQLLTNIDENKIVFSMICLIVLAFALQIIVPIALAIYQLVFLHCRKDVKIINEEQK